MLRIRKVADATTPANRAAVEAAQQIMREQFSGMPDQDIAKLPDQLSNPLKHRLVPRLFVAENARDQTPGIALLLYFPDIGFSYLEIISTARGRMGGGIGAALYERVREEARALGTQLYFESLPDDPALSPDPEVQKANAARLKFYERYGARPIINTAYETAVTPGDTDSPYLVLDPLGSSDLPSADMVRKVTRAILERKYRGLPAKEVQLVVNSIADDPIRLREPRYVKSRRALKAEMPPPGEPRIGLVLNDEHALHHVQDRGDLEAPVYTRSIMAEDVGRVRSLVAATGFFNTAEIEIAAELVTERLTKGIRSGYNFVLAERGSELVAYACYGQIDGTKDSFDLYWIAVAPEQQAKGLGTQVYRRAEAAMRKAGAKRVYADTSSSDRYAPTRRFYERMGFRENARLNDFYAPGDGKVIYCKELGLRRTAD